MKNYQMLWKLHNSSGNVDFIAHIEYAILKAVFAYTIDNIDDKIKMAEKFISKAYTPTTDSIKINNSMDGNPYKNLMDAFKYIRFKLQSKYRIFDAKLEDIFTSEDELKNYAKIVNHLCAINTNDISRLHRKYCYIFVDTSYPSEVQMVQAAHVSMVVGKNLKNDEDPYKIYYQIVELPSNHTADSISRLHYDYDFFKFYEPDLNECIAAAIKPVFWYECKPFEKYELVIHK